LISYDIAMELFREWGIHPNAAQELEYLSSEIMREFVRCGIWLDLLRH
jgi:hypothetical protein